MKYLFNNLHWNEQGSFIWLEMSKILFNCMLGFDVLPNTIVCDSSGKQEESVALDKRGFCMFWNLVLLAAVLCLSYLNGELCF